jgi:hypothetical protein
MVEMEELIIMATDDEPVRRYLRRMDMREHDVTKYVTACRKGEPVTISFGSDDEGEILPLQLCPDGLRFELTSPTASEACTSGRHTSADTLTGHEKRLSGPIPGSSLRP